MKPLNYLDSVGWHRCDRGLDCRVERGHPILRRDDSGLRVSEEEETEGLDVSTYGERGYNL